MKWQNLNQEEKKIYQDKADADKLRYRRELKEFEKEVDKLELKKNIRSVDWKPRNKKSSQAAPVITLGKRSRGQEYEEAKIEEIPWANQRSIPQTRNSRGVKNPTKFSFNIREPEKTSPQQFSA